MGCDGAQSERYEPDSDFNPRTPVGCDAVAKTMYETSGISIHAPQWGATGRIRLGVMLLIHFNPRTPVGCDFAPLVILASGIPISIHAPQWGITPEILRKLVEGLR